MAMGLHLQLSGHRMEALPSREGAQDMVVEAVAISTPLLGPILPSPSPTTPTLKGLTAKW